LFGSTIFRGSVDLFESVALLCGGFLPGGRVLRRLGLLFNTSGQGARDRDTQ
jgi:hypothetical protein